MEKLLLKPAEAAELLGLSRSAVYEMVRRRELPSVKVGRGVKLPTEALRGWVRDLAEAGGAR